MRSLIGISVAAFMLNVPAAGSDEMTPVAAGDWSEWHRDLRGRLLLFKGRSTVTAELRETLVFVELENRIGSGRQLDVYFDARNLRCELRDASDEVVPDRPVTENQRRFREGRQPQTTWVTVPDASALRLRVSPYCVGTVDDLLIPVRDTNWLIEAGAGDFFLSGALTISPPEDHTHPDAWHGTLNLPTMRIDTDES